MEFERAASARVREAEGLTICGAGSKQFMYAGAAAHRLDVTANAGVLVYEPAELVVTVAAGTRLADLAQMLGEHGQTLAADPPRFGGHGTVGGALAVGLSGPGRPWQGALRDAVLGVRLLTGHGEIHQFGGRVMKNVAGYDIARLQVGAHGTLGVILAASLRVQPIAETEVTLAFVVGRDAALERVIAWGRRPLPITATCHVGDVLHVRLAGTESGVSAAARELGGERADADVWAALRDHRLPFFGDRSIWRVSLPPASPYPAFAGDWLTEWGGALRWCATTADGEAIRGAAASLGGYAFQFRSPFGYARLDPKLARYHANLKAAFDPHGKLNADRTPGAV